MGERSRDEGFRVGKEDVAFERLKDSWCYWSVDSGHI